MYRLDVELSDDEYKKLLDLLIPDTGLLLTMIEGAKHVS